MLLPIGEFMQRKNQMAEEEFEILEDEKVAVTKDTFNSSVEVPKNHISLLSDIDVNAVEYEPSITESLATESGPLGPPLFIASTGGPTLIADLATQGTNPELLFGSLALGIGAWTGSAAKRQYNEAKKNSAQDTIEDIYLIGDEDVEGFLENQDRVLVDTEASKDVWAGRDAADLYSRISELSLVTFEDYNEAENIGYQIDLFPTKTTFYGIDEDASQYFEDADPLYDSINQIKEDII